jgi:hypothetical protein
VSPSPSVLVLGEPFSPTGDKTVFSQSKLFCPNDVGDKIVLSRDLHCPRVWERDYDSRRCLSGHTRNFFRLSGTDQADVVLHIICERII